MSQRPVGVGEQPCVHPEGKRGTWWWVPFLSFPRGQAVQSAALLQGAG